MFTRTIRPTPSSNRHEDRSDWTVEQYQDRLHDLGAIGVPRNNAEVRTLKAELKKLKEEEEQIEQGITGSLWQEEREEQARLRGEDSDAEDDEDSDREDEKQHSRQFEARHAYRRRALQTIGLKAEWAQLRNGKREPGGSFAMWHWVKMTPAMRLVFHAHLHFRDHRTDQSRATRRQVAHLTMMDPTNVSHALKQIVALGLLTVERERRGCVYTFRQPDQWSHSTRQQAFKNFCRWGERVGVTSFKRPKVRK